MSKMRIFLMIILLPLISSCDSDFEGGTSKKMQEDYDKIRLDHIQIIDSLVIEYKEKTGHFPYENYPSDIPIVVTIASDEQIKNDDGRSRIFVDLNTRSTDGNQPEKPKSIEKISLQKFTKELENALQRQVSIPIDPQKVPVNKPSLYYYVYYLGVYDITAFLHNQFSFARPLTQFNNKITVGTYSYPSEGIWYSADLRQQEEFRTFFQSPLNK